MKNLSQSLPYSPLQSEEWEKLESGLKKAIEGEDDVSKSFNNVTSSSAYSTKSSESKFEDMESIWKNK